MSQLHHHTYFTVIRWRRRFFVLYAPPAASMMPGTCSAVLDYYDNDRQLFKKGTIDLTSCVEVTLQPEIEYYRHVFSLRTKHRGRDRTYYLFSDTEDDMKHWVECLRAVLFLEGSYDGGRDTFLQHPSNNVPVQSVTCERYISLPEHSPSSMPSLVTEAPVLPSNSATAHLQSSPTVASSTSAAQDSNTAEDDNYILLEDCYSGPTATSSVSQSTTNLSKIQNSKNYSTSGQHAASTGIEAGNSSSLAEYCNVTDRAVHGDLQWKQAAAVPHYSTSSDEVRLPTKKFGVSASSSSTDESSDESDDSSTFHSHGSHTANERGVAPPVPVRPPLLPADTITYLDLDHSDAASSTAGNLSSSRPSLTSTAAASSDYKEIDWIKTKALIVTRKDVENKLKGTEN